DPPGQPLIQPVDPRIQPVDTARNPLIERVEPDTEPITQRVDPRGQVEHAAERAEQRCREDPDDRPERGLHAGWSVGPPSDIPGVRPAAPSPSSSPPPSRRSPAGRRA